MVVAAKRGQWLNSAQGSTQASAREADFLPLAPRRRGGRVIIGRVSRRMTA